MHVRRLLSTQNVPEIVRAQFHRVNTHSDNDHGETQLWREAAALAVLDACDSLRPVNEREVMENAKYSLPARRKMLSGRRKAYNDQREVITDARDWFKSNSADLHEVFCNAGIDCDTIRRAMLAYISAHPL